VIQVPPAPAEDDEPTMPNGPYDKHGIYVQCPLCDRWGTYGYTELAETRYDVVWRRTTCPSCRQETPFSYNSYALPENGIVMFSCAWCNQPLRVSVTAGNMEKKQPYTQEQAMIVRYLEQANEELLGLHRYGALTYAQYTDIANPLVEAQEKLKKHMKRLAQEPKR
jgi:hypothetical protein